MKDASYEEELTPGPVEFLKPRLEGVGFWGGLTYYLRRNWEERMRQILRAISLSSRMLNI